MEFLNIKNLLQNRNTSELEEEYEKDFSKKAKETN